MSLYVVLFIYLCRRTEEYFTYTVTNVMVGSKARKTRRKSTILRRLLKTFPLTTVEAKPACGIFLKLEEEHCTLGRLHTRRKAPFAIFAYIHENISQYE